MPNPSNYTCSKCGRVVERDQIKVKKVQFKEVGAHGRVVRSRTTEWLCDIPHEDGTESCLKQDADYSRRQWSDAPGFKETVLADER